MNARSRLKLEAAGHHVQDRRLAASFTVHDLVTGAKGVRTRITPAGDKSAGDATKRAKNAASPAVKMPDETMLPHCTALAVCAACVAAA